MKNLTLKAKVNILKNIKVANLSKTEFYELSDEIDKMDLVKIEALANKKLHSTFIVSDDKMRKIKNNLMENWKNNRRVK